MYENKKIDSVKIEKSDYAISRLEERTNDLLKTCYETNTSNSLNVDTCDLSFFYRDEKGNYR